MKATPRPITRATHPREISMRVRARKLSLLLDYDGTLVPFTSHPDRAAPDPELRRLIAGVAKRPRTSVEIVSGRDPASLGRWFGDLDVSLRAEHGAWTRARGKPLWSAAVPVRTRSVQD
ncbi:MAG TPA: trehalose-phosphatase, partial [Gaiellaceae bacterium]|nr:trehalose-phosphatase [Gaiellaceae bacterium]